MSRGSGQFSMARNLAERLSFSVIPVAPTIERPLPPSPSMSGADTRSLPRQRALLSWLFAARTLLAVGTLLAAALVWTTTPDVSFIFSIAVLVTLVATAYGWWRVRIRGGESAASSWWDRRWPISGWSPRWCTIQRARDLRLALRAGHRRLRGAAAAAARRAGHGVRHHPVRLRYIAGRLVRPGRGILGPGGGVQRGLRDRRGAGPPAARAEWSRTRWRPNCGGCGSRPMTSSRTSAPGCSPSTARAGSPSSIRWASGCSARRRPNDRTPDPGHAQARSPEMWAAMVAAIRHGRKVSRSEGTVQDDGRVFPIGLCTTTFRPRIARRRR